LEQPEWIDAVKCVSGKVVFMGTGKIGLPVLRWLANAALVELAAVVTQPDKPAGRSQVLTPSPIKALATELNLPVLQPQRVRRPEELERIATFSPEFIVVMAYGQILPKALLEMPAIACINLHASLLPRHRGAAPIQASILEGDKSTGITVMYMAEGLDAGDILLTQSVPIRRRETGGSLHDRLAEIGPGILGSALELLLAGKAPRIPQEESRATYAPKLERKSGAIDWSRDCWYLDRLVRAMNPWPGAFTWVQSSDGAVKKLKVHIALPMHRMAGRIGVVERVGRRGITVGCGGGSLLLREVQIEGKRRLAAAEFVRGFRLLVGTRLGVDR
jgi:methionyl-tRNA formyltransferase